MSATDSIVRDCYSRGGQCPLSETATAEGECPLSETATVEGECPLSQTATVEGDSVRCQRLLQ